MKLYDNHAHLDDSRFDEDREELINNIKQEMQGCISVGYDIQSCEFVSELTKKYEFIHGACAISPNDIPQSENELLKEIEKIEQIIKNNKKIIAIGETGLDYYWNKDNENHKEMQRKAFKLHIELANKLDLPITIHTRDASIDTIRILKENEVINKGVFHCCPLNRELIKEGLNLGFYISFAGPITFKNSKNADDIINMVPLDKILIETDSPYLSPEPNRGKRNDPRNVKYIAQKIADVRGLSLEEITEITYNNAKKIYKI